MKGQSDIVSALQSLKRAHDHFESFIREKPGSLAERMFKGYAKRIDWIVNDFLSCPHFPQEVRDGIRGEWLADAFTTIEVHDKIALLPPDRRECLENVIDLLLKGDKLELEVKSLEKIM